MKGIHWSKTSLLDWEGKVVYHGHMGHTIGFIGLGRMGKNMVLHLLESGIHVVAFNRTKEKAEALKTENPRVEVASTVEELVGKIPSPRIIWLMVPNGAPIDEMLEKLIQSGIQKGDIVIDGGNTYYKDTVRRSHELAKHGVFYVDCGTSGGLEGARNGACLMLGGEEPVVAGLNWLWEKAAVKDGFSYFGPSGAGHFVKMVHNGIEYGMNQAIGEGLEVLSKGPYVLDFARIAKTWSNGSVIRGWLIELLADALKKDPKLDTFSGHVGGGETGEWTKEAAKELGVAAPVLEDALAARKQSLTKPSFAGKVVSALRAGYGGHKEP